MYLLNGPSYNRQSKQAIYCSKSNQMTPHLNTDGKQQGSLEQNWWTEEAEKQSALWESNDFRLTTTHTKHKCT